MVRPTLNDNKENAMKAEVLFYTGLATVMFVIIFFGKEMAIMQALTSSCLICLVTKLVSYSWRGRLIPLRQTTQ